jgi:hypothetical protein
MLSGASVRILPVLLEDCDLPPLLSDIKFADFRTKYKEGLDQLLKSLAGSS